MGQFEIVALAAALEKPKGAASAVAGAVELFMPLEGLLDLNLEKQRLEKEISKLRNLSEAVSRRLENEAFVSKAPQDLVNAERRKIEEYGQAIEKLDSSLKAIAS